MNRLTNRLSDGTAYVVSETGTEGVGAITTQRRLPELIARLAQYEDTGLEPDEIKRSDALLRGFIDLSRRHARTLHWIEEVMIADREGRLLVPPCRVGDIVFLIVPGLSSPMPVPVCSLTWRGGKWSINADREETEPPKVVNFQIGKTAFLTREDAEKALEGMKNDK